MVNRIGSAGLWPGASMARCVDGPMPRKPGAMMAQCDDGPVRRWSGTRMVRCDNGPVKNGPVRRWSGAKMSVLVAQSVKALAGLTYVFAKGRSDRVRDQLTPRNSLQ